MDEREESQRNHIPEGNTTVLTHGSSGHPLPSLVESPPPEVAQSLYVEEGRTERHVPASKGRDIPGDGALPSAGNPVAAPFQDFRAVAVHAPPLSRCTGSSDALGGQELHIDPLAGAPAEGTPVEPIPLDRPATACGGATSESPTGTAQSEIHQENANSRPGLACDAECALTNREYGTSIPPDYPQPLTAPTGSRILQPGAEQEGPRNTICPGNSRIEHAAMATLTGNGDNAVAPAIADTDVEAAGETPGTPTGLPFPTSGMQTASETSAVAMIASQTAAPLHSRPAAKPSPEIPVDSILSHSSQSGPPSIVDYPRSLSAAAVATPDIKATTGTEPMKRRSVTAEEEADDLPAFANEENITLYSQIKEKQQLLAHRGTALGHKAERVALMREHLQQLRAEAEQLENLAAAKDAHINSEQHMDGVAHRQTSKFKSEIRQQQQHQEQLQSRLIALQLEVARGHEQIDCFKLRMKWSEEELSQWRSAAHQKQEDLECIAEFKKKDDARAAELIMQAQKASVELTEAKKRLREEETAARAARAELQRALEHFALHQKDRALLIAQGQQTQNKELQGELASLEQQLTSCRSTYATATTAISHLSEEVAALRGQISAVATRWKAAKGQLAELHESLASQQQRLEKLNKKKEAARQRLTKEQGNVRSAGEAGQASEAFKAQADARLQQLQLRVKASRDKLFGIAQKLAEEKAALKMKRGGISSLKNALKSLHAQLQQQEAEKSRQQELLYAIDFQCQAMQRRVSRVSGYKTAAETKTLKKQIKELQAEVAVQQEEQSMLAAQVKHIESELRKAHRSLVKAGEEDDRCSSSVGTIRLTCASLDRELQRALKEKEELVVAESIKKLEVTRIREELEACADASLEAENRKAQQKLQAQEALAAMDVELDKARCQLRAMEEERHKLNKEATERRAKIASLEAKYASILQNVDGAGRSQAYYVIRAGQEREELQRRISEIHRKLQSASAEVEGLQATLRDVALSNTRLRSRLQKESGILGTLREKQAQMEGTLFLRNRMEFTQQQHIAKLNEAIKAEQCALKQTKEVHQCTLDKLVVRGTRYYAFDEKYGVRVALKEEVEEQMKNLRKESASVDEKLQRNLQQRQKLQTSLQQRRPAASATGPPEGQKLGNEVCNAEMQYHAESLKNLLQNLYRAMGPLLSANPSALEALQRALAEGESASSPPPHCPDSAWHAAAAYQVKQREAQTPTSNGSRFAVELKLVWDKSLLQFVIPGAGKIESLAFGARLHKTAYEVLYAFVILASLSQSGFACLIKNDTSFKARRTAEPSLAVTVEGHVKQIETKLATKVPCRICLAHYVLRSRKIGRSVAEWQEDNHKKQDLIIRYCSNKRSNLSTTSWALHFPMVVIRPENRIGPKYQRYPDSERVVIKLLQEAHDTGQAGGSIGVR
ncbi:coiled-coil domain-containing protein 39 [Cyclospora cayetanensis]|uniref:Coiled-coil domain-containing protein 39 n=1 Tax=Cyclospora cayetanensis TaxID=88456 RepID=A0A6P6RST3_9EIME|nr:coiled-coil domain-containing protein 39 [Cyclospora cayetanensis]